MRCKILTARLLGAKILRFKEKDFFVPMAAHDYVTLELSFMEATCNGWITHLVYPYSHGILNSLAVTGIGGG